MYSLVLIILIPCRTVVSVKIILYILFTSIVLICIKTSNNKCPIAGDINNGVVSSDWKVIVTIITDNFVIAIILIGLTVIVLVVIVRNCNLAVIGKNVIGP